MSVNLYVIYLDTKSSVLKAICTVSTKTKIQVRGTLAVCSTIHFSLPHRFLLIRASWSNVCKDEITFIIVPYHFPVWVFEPKLSLEIALAALLDAIPRPGQGLTGMTKGRKICVKTSISCIFFRIRNHYTYEIIHSNENVKISLMYLCY